jgi:uncharacterized protein YdhG (YjbR/CyaY superfamily)
MSTKKATQDKPAKSAAGRKASSGLTAEERAAMKERLRELKAEERMNKDRAAGERALLEKVAEMPEPDRSLATRIHEIVTTSAPELMPRTWYGMPAYAREGKSSASSRTRASSTRGTRPSASTTLRTSTTATCGRRRSRS